MRHFSATVSWPGRFVHAIGFGNQVDADAAAWRLAYAHGYTPPRWWQLVRLVFERGNPPHRAPEPMRDSELHEVMGQE